jgi:prepilin-type processing-associated H-X9-DG protein
MSFNVGGYANQQGSMTGSNYLVNIIELQNVITSATGLTPIEQVQNQVAALETMVNVAQKRIFTNIISKFDQTPIQITDDINLSNALLYQNGVLFTGSGTTTGGGTTNISSGGTSITLTNTTSGLSTAIGFNVGGRTVFSFDGQGRALYFDPSGTGNRFWVSSATLVADTLQVGGNPTPGMVLTAISSTGLSQWNYVSTMKTTQGNSINLSSAGIFFHTGNLLAQDAGRVDSNRNWYLGKPSLTGNGDLVTSNDFTVIGGRLRYQGGGTPVAGQVLTISDSLGNVILSNVGAGSLSSFVVGNQIQSGSTSVKADGAGQFVTFSQGASELMRVTGTGRVGIGTAAPTQALDVNGNAVIGGSLTVAPGTGASGYVFTASGVGGTGSWQPNSNLISGTNQWAVNGTIPAFQGILNGTEQLRFSTGGALLGVNGSYNLKVNGVVAASAFASLSPLRFWIGATETEVGRFTDSGDFGIGTSTPNYKLEVAGSQSNSGSLNVGTSLAVATNANIGGTVVAGFLSGNGSNVTNIQTVNVGSGSNRLDTFQTTTRIDIQALKVSVSSLSTTIFSTLDGYNLAGGLSFYSTLSSIIYQNSNGLSSMIGPGAGAVVSTYSTSVGIAMAAQFSTLSSYIVTNTSQFSTLSTMISTTSVDDRAYASTIAFSTASTLVTVGISSLLSTGGIFRGPVWMSSLAVGYKYGQDMSGTIDTNGLIYAQGLRGLSSPFGIGVGSSSLQQFIGYGYTSSIGWRTSFIGDLDISGLLYRNGQLYTVQGQPDVYWSRNGSNIWFADGNVGIGLTNPSYPLDVAGRIRCFGVDVIPGPGPNVSTGQGSYVSPWVYQGSNIYYNLGGAGIGTGISSVLSGVAWDVSGPVRIRNGPTYISSLAVNIPYGSTMVAAADIFGSLRARSLVVDSTGAFAGRVTAKDFLSLSDRRFKDNIELISNPETILSSIRGVRFQWKDSHVDDVGCVAQEVANQLPEAVSGDIESGLHVAYDKLVPVLVEAVKHLLQRVDSLEKRLGP